MIKFSPETGETINCYIIVRLRGPHGGRSLDETKTYPIVVGSDISTSVISDRKGVDDGI